MSCLRAARSFVRRCSLSIAVSRGVVDMADIAQRVRRIRAIQHAIRLPGRGIGTHRQALEFAAARRGHKRAILLDLQLRLDADIFEVTLHQLHGIEDVGASAPR